MQNFCAAFICCLPGSRQAIEFAVHWNSSSWSRSTRKFAKKKCNSFIYVSFFVFHFVISSSMPCSVSGKFFWPRSRLSVSLLIVIHKVRAIWLLWVSWVASQPNYLCPPLLCMCCVRCTYQSLIEGKIASQSVCVSVCICLQMRHIFRRLGKSNATSRKQSTSQRKEIIYTLSEMGRYIPNFVYFYTTLWLIRQVN